MTWNIGYSEVICFFPILSVIYNVIEMLKIKLKKKLILAIHMTPLLTNTQCGVWQSLHMLVRVTNIKVAQAVFCLSFKHLSWRLVCCDWFGLSHCYFPNSVRFWCWWKHDLAATEVNSRILRSSACANNWLRTSCDYIFTLIFCAEVNPSLRIPTQDLNPDFNPFH